MSTNDKIDTPKVEATNSDVVDIAADKRSTRKVAIREFVHAHPGLLLAGGVVTGLAIASLVPRRTGKTIVKRTSALSKFIGAAAVSFGEDAAHRAADAGTQIRKGSHVVADHAEDWTAIALRHASALAQTAAENMTKLGETAAEKAEQFGDAAADSISKVGQHASKRLDKTLPVAEAAATHAGKRVGEAIAQLRARIAG